MKTEILTNRLAIMAKNYSTEEHGHMDFYAQSILYPGWMMENFARIAYAESESIKLYDEISLQLFN